MLIAAVQRTHGTVAVWLRTLCILGLQLWLAEQKVKSTACLLPSTLSHWLPNNQKPSPA